MVKESRLSRQQRLILSALLNAGRQGVTNVHLNAIAFRYGARIFELRKLGHKIATSSLGKGLWLFVLDESGK